ncbi:MAG: DUF420 domain-containing protein, partial [Planctomycetota bacterium]
MSLTALALLDGTDLPAFNACCNAAATVLLVLGGMAIHGERTEARKHRHAKLMTAAGLVSALFLAGYLTYHFGVQAELGATKFNREGFVKTAYLVMLLTHVVLAAVNLPMVILTFVFAAKKNWTAHRKLAKWTYPIWLYVSVTGVLVYLALYHWNP